MSAWSRAGLALALLLASCQPLPHPFARDKPSAALVAVPDSVDIAVDPFTGEPRATAQKLAPALAQEIVKHGIPASDETVSKGSYRLDGRIEALPDRPGQSLVAVMWQLRDPNGKLVHEGSSRASAPTHDWDSGADGAIAQLASAGAEGLAALLVDQTPKEQPGPKRTRVAVRKIAGAPGDGDTALVNSMTALLKHQDLDLVDPAQGHPDFAIDADVKVDPVKDGKQHVKIVWHVMSVAGGEVGQAAQENDVPRGQLDGPWGDTAYSVAMAAEGGVMQLISRAAPQAGKRAPGTNPDAPPSVTGVPGAPPPDIANGPPVAGNVDSPVVNLPPIDVKPTPGTPPTPPATPDAPQLLPYRGVMIPH